MTCGLTVLVAIWWFIHGRSHYAGAQVYIESNSETGENITYLETAEDDPISIAQSLK